ncbi:MAG: hypothetical protein PHR51_01935 [Patescibacteria group bacterium]|nr:hypothetical protein [Patescibacteria group bacterium]
MPRWTRVGFLILAWSWLASWPLGAVSGCNQQGSKSSQELVPITIAEAPDCELYLVKAGTSHQALVCIGGWQNNQWLTLERAQLVFDVALSNFASIDANQTIPRWGEISIYMLAYDTSKGADVLAEQFVRLFRADKMLAKNGTRCVFLCHSYGGLVGSELEARDREQVLGSLNAGTPWNGTGLLDEGALTQAAENLYTQIGQSVVAQGWTSLVDFRTDSVAWMAPDSQMREQARLRTDCANKFFYVGAVAPAGDDILSRNLNLAGLFDANVWHNTEIQNRQLYALGARLIQEINGEASDGMVMKSSASAQGWLGAEQVRVVGERNHVQVITGSQGDMWLHQQMYQDIMALFWSDPKLNAPHFDVVMPQVPMIDLPADWVSHIKRGDIVFIRDQQLYVASADGKNEYKLSVEGLKCKWPQWLDTDSVIFTGVDNQGQSDIYLLSDNRAVLRLTQTGQSQMAVPLGFGMVFEEGDTLVYRSMGGLAKILVTDGVHLTNPPAVLGEQIYFAHQADDGMNRLYCISLDDASRRLGVLPAVAQGTRTPIRLGNAILAVGVNGDQTSLTVVAGSVGQPIMVATQYLNQHNLVNLESIKVNGQCSRLYVVMDEVIRTITISEFLSVVGAKYDWSQMLQDQTVTLPRIESLLATQIQGSELDTK